MRKKSFLQEKKVALRRKPLYNQLDIICHKKSADLLQAATQLLLRHNLSIACAESCTGGLLSSTLTDQAGSSAYFVGGIVSYQTRIKLDFLQVPAAAVEAHGVVSDAVAAAMAEGIKREFGADYGIGITGAAGPGPLEGNPAGRVHIAIDGPLRTTAVQYDLAPGERKTIKCKAVAAALQLLLDELAARHYSSQ